MHKVGNSKATRVHSGICLPVLKSHCAPAGLFCVLAASLPCLHSRHSLSHTYTSEHTEHTTLHLFSSLSKVVHICTYKALALQSPAGRLGGPQPFASIHREKPAHPLPPLCLPFSSPSPAALLHAHSISSTPNPFLAPEPPWTRTGPLHLLFHCLKRLLLVLCKLPALPSSWVILKCLLEWSVLIALSQQSPSVPTSLISSFFPSWHFSQ